jgi:hypothetical protein
MWSVTTHGVLRMVSTAWKAALLLGMVSAGLAWGQTPPAPNPAPNSPRRVISLRENGGPELKCRLLEKWTTAEGRSALLLEEVASAERLTVVTYGDSAATQTVRIWHWGNDPSPPEDSPIPPGSAKDQGIRTTRHTTENPSPVGTSGQAIIPDLSVARPPMPHQMAEATPCPGCKPSSDCNTFVHRYERPPEVSFKPGPCVPIVAPYHTPNYGYYATQWRPWPGAEGPGMPLVEEPINPDRELLPPPTTLPGTLGSRMPR